MGEMTKNAKNTTHSERKHTPLPWHQGGEVREELMSPDTIFGADGAAIAKFYGISLHRTLAELDPKMCADGLGNIATVVEAVNGYVALERENAGLRAALEVIELAIRDDRGETYWPARKFLDDRGIFNGDLNDLRVVHAVAKFALGQSRPLAHRERKMYSYPKTIEQAREYPYQNGRAYMEGCCAMEVNPHHGIANQCGRRKGFGPANLYCKAHTQKAAPGEAGEKG